MESLLALAFDNLSSYDDLKVKKGARQIEGVLASLCLNSKAGTSSKGQRKGGRKRSPDSTDVEEPCPQPIKKSLDQLGHDPAFREFFKTQEGFQYNIATHLLDTLERLFARGEDGRYDLLIVSVMDLLQGVILLHPPSKKLFGREKGMNLILDLIEPVNCPAIQVASLSLLAILLMDCPANIRLFESLDGLLAIASLHSQRGTSRSVRTKITEVLYIYLMPETPSIPRAGTKAGDLLQPRSPSKLPAIFSPGACGSGGENGRRRVSTVNCGSGGDLTLGVEDKIELLGRHVGDVDEFVMALRGYEEFSSVMA